MRLDPVIIGSDTKIEEILKYFMGKNTPERQEFIIDNLKVEEDLEKEHEEIIVISNKITSKYFYLLFFNDVFFYTAFDYFIFRKFGNSSGFD